jgi:hypothetical protein
MDAMPTSGQEGGKLMGDAPLKVTAKQLDDGGIEDTTADKEPTTGVLCMCQAATTLLCPTTTHGRQGANPGRPVPPPALQVLLTFT